MSGKHKLFASALASLELRKGSRMVFVPGTDRRDEGRWYRRGIESPGGLTLASR